MEVEIIKSVTEKITTGTTYNWQVNEKLGKGSYGFVFSIRGENFVVKIIYDEPTGNNVIFNAHNEFEICNRFVDAKLEWCNILALGYLARDYKVNKKILKKGYKCIIMPYFVKMRQVENMTGHELFVKDCYLVGYMMDLIKIHKEMEDMGLLNIDIKSNNVMMDSENRLVLVDFGLIIDLGAEGDTFSGRTEGEINYYTYPQVAMLRTHVHAYIIAFLVLELTYWHDRIYDVCKQKHVKRIIDDFMSGSKYSAEFKAIIRDCILGGGMTLNTLEKRLGEYIAVNGLAEHLRFPSLYSIVCDRHMIKPVSRIFYK